MGKTNHGDRNVNFINELSNREGASSNPQEKEKLMLDYPNIN